MTTSINIFAKEKLFSGLAKEIAIERTLIPPRETAQILLHINGACNYDCVNYTCNFVESIVCIVIALSVANPGTVRDSQLR